MIQQKIDQDKTSTQQKSLLNPPSTKPPPIPPLLHSKRLRVVVLMCLCFLNTTFIRFNIGIAIVQMTSVKQIEKCNLTIFRPPEFDWDSETIGTVMSLFYYGGLLSFLGGYMTTKLGGATSCALSTLVSGLTTILHPVTLYYGFYTFLTTRFITGVFENFVLISISEVCSKWVPKNERGKLMSYVTTGFGVGTSIVHTVCGYLAHIWNWPMIFYVTGTMSLVLSLSCFILIKNHPSEDKWITEAELRYIEYQQENTAAAGVPKKTMVETYRCIFLSAPIWALLVAKFTFNWWIGITASLLPLYIKDVTGYETDKVGVFSSIPNVANTLATPFVGILLDYTRKKNIPLTLTHKISISGSYVLGAVLFSSVVIIRSFIPSMIFFSLAQVSLGVISLVTKIIVISIAPIYSGVVSGIDMLFSSISSIVSRSVTGYMTTNRTPEEWNNCFILASGLFVFSAVTFAMYGSSDPQPWSLPSTLSDIHEEELVQENQAKK